MQKSQPLKLDRTTRAGISLSLIFCAAVLGAKPICKVIDFTGFEPDNFTNTEVWCGIGIDHNEKVYLGITDEALRDVAVLRYDSRTGSKELLGTLKGISAADSNLGPNEHWEEEETFSKIHSPILEFENKMYFSSHDFFKKPDSEAELLSHRGGHFYSYDLESGQFSDLSKTDSAGVSVPHQSIITMNIMPEQRKLIGWTYPYGDVLAYDLATGKTVSYQGPAGYRTLNGAVSRVIMSASNEKVYFSYGIPQTYLWELDLKTGAMDSLTYTGLLNTGMFNGLCKTKSGDTLYLKDKNGDLYRFAPGTQTFDRLGTILPDQEILMGKTLRQNSGLVLSKDETKLYTIPYGVKGTASYRLFEYDLLTGGKRTLGVYTFELWGRVITGSAVVDDSNRIYFATYDPFWNKPTAIAQIDLRPMSGIRDGEQTVAAAISNVRPTMRWNHSAGQARIRLPGQLSRGYATIQILDVSGRLVRELRSHDSRSVFWDGRSRKGVRVPAGVYLMRIRAKDRFYNFRVNVLR